jgi:hypothetical protein
VWGGAFIRTCACLILLGASVAPPRLNFSSYDRVGSEPLCDIRTGILYYSLTKLGMSAIVAGNLRFTTIKKALTTWSRSCTLLA